MGYRGNENAQFQAELGLGWGAWGIKLVEPAFLEEMGWILNISYCGQGSEPCFCCMLGIVFFLTYKMPLQYIMTE